jgi:uncharacterized protein (DUF952 family)
MTRKYVFKIVTTEPDPNSQKFELSELDKQSGFIHLSTGQQIPHTCDRFFASISTLYIFRFPRDKLQANLKWEATRDGDELFPHLYGDLLNEDMDSARVFIKRGNSWMDVLGNESWLRDYADDLKGD